MQNQKKKENEKWTRVLFLQNNIDHDFSNIKKMIGNTSQYFKYHIKSFLKLSKKMIFVKVFIIIEILICIIIYLKFIFIIRILLNRLLKWILKILVIHFHWFTLKVFSTCHMMRVLKTIFCCLHPRISCRLHHMRNDIWPSLPIISCDIYFLGVRLKCFFKILILLFLLKYISQF